MFKLAQLIRFFVPTLHLDSGGGGGGGPSTSTTQTSNIPEYARPYVETMLGATQQQLFNTKQKTDPTTGQTSTEITGMRPFQAFGGTYDMNKTITNDKGETIDNPNYGKQTGYNVDKYFAGWQPLQERAFGSAATMGVSPQNQTATDMATLAGLGALAAQYNPARFANQYQAPDQYQSGQFGAPIVSAQNLQTFQMQGPQNVSATGNEAAQMQAAQTGYAPNLQNYQMGPAQQVSTESFAQPGKAQDYMSPYMQNVVDVQQREARRASDIQAQQNAAQAVGQGAFGGSRAALVEAERQRNLGTRLSDIQATGQQAAYQQAQQQFNQEQQARLQAQQANQQAGLTVGQQNLAANLGIQQLGTQTGLQTALSNLSNQQQANVQNQAAQLQAMGLNSAQALQAALANQQAGLTTGQQNLQAQLGVQSLGAGQNLQAQQLNQAAALQAQQAAEQSRQYGYGQNMTAAQLQAQYGLSADQAAEASRQFGANYGLQGLSTGLNAANQLGTLGQNQYNQRVGTIGLQNQLGTQQQQLEQQKVNQQIQDYATQQQWAMQQLSNMNAMLRGLPLQTTSTQTYQAAPSLTSQLAGAGTAAIGASKLMARAGGSTKDIKKRGGSGGLEALGLYNAMK